jgi:hypothetical protein
MLTDNQLEELKDLLTTGSARNLTASMPDGATNPDGTLKYPPNGERTETAAAWLTIGDAGALYKIVNQEANLGLPPIANDAANKAEIISAVITGAEYSSETTPMLLQDLGLVVGDRLLFSDAPKVGAIEKMLTGYDDCLANFEALKTRNAKSLNDYYGGIDQADINNLIALVAG